MEALNGKRHKTIENVRGKAGNKQIRTLALTQKLMPYHFRIILALKGRELTLELSRAPLTWKHKQIIKH